MAPSLQGLNLIHPPHTESSAQDLLAGPAFPDLLWNNLVFDSDESIPEDKYSNKHARDVEDDHDLDLDHSTDSILHQGHVNVVSGTNASSAQPPFDVNNFLATFAQPASGISPSIVQLLALHSAMQNVAPQQEQQSAPSPAPARAASSDFPPPKRARTRKASVSSNVPDSPEEAAATALGIAEDKRRRNTAASARFRLKKKEREAALETRAKELEGRVNELERECEGLRRENGWLKGLVVGVTGAAQAPQQQTNSLKRGREEVDA